MNAQRQLDSSYVSVEEYYDILLSGDIKYEWFNGMMWPVGNPDNLPQMMAGAQPEHNDIKNNIETRLSVQLEDGPCRVRSSDQQIKVEASEILAFPDLTVVCEEARYETVRGLRTLLNPLVLIEILSPTTASFDRDDKRAHYQLIPSLRDYLIVFCEQMRVEHFARQGDNSWLERVWTRPDDVVELSGVAARLTMREIYRRIEFPEETSSRTPRVR